MTRPGGAWENWARTARIRPQRVEYPPTTSAVQRAVVAAARRGLRVKAVGSGHSFTDIAAAPDVLLELKDLTGLVRVDRARGRVTLRGGTRLHQIPRLLAPYRLAMPNLGDIDRQSISGAVSTGTHGTGSGFGGIATQVVGLRLVTATGDLVEIDEDHNPELLPAAAVGLGALGVIVEVTLQCVPSFLLHAVERPEPLAEVLGALDERTAADHFEFYWFPHTDVALTKTNTRLPGSAARHPLRPVGKWVDETVLANGVYRVACAAGMAVPPVSPPFSRLAVRLTGDREYTDWSSRVFTQRRTVRFREMEYALPAAHVATAFAEVRDLIVDRGWRISFPLEVRFTAADDLWMSTAYGRDSGYIAVHRYFREDSAEYFDAVEEIMLAHGGRPHWGKMHTRDAASLRSLYPRFDDFTDLRDRWDPERTFSNEYLARVLGE